MASQIEIQQSFVATKDGNDLVRQKSQKYTIAQAAAGAGVPGTITITTAGVDIDLSALGTEGVCQITNLDGTNFVEWGPKVTGTFHPIGKLKPGEFPHLFRLSPGKTLHLKADTASCLVQVLAQED